jgi:hypothetical protein
MLPWEINSFGEKELVGLATWFMVRDHPRVLIYRM